MENKKRIAFFMHYRPGGGGVNTLATFYIKKLSEKFLVDLYLEGKNVQEDIDCYPKELNKYINSLTYYNINPFRTVFMHGSSTNFLIKSDIEEINNFISEFNKNKYKSVIMFVGFHEFLFKFMTNVENKISFVHTRFLAQKELKNLNFLDMSRYCDKWICVSEIACDEFKEYLPHRKNDIDYVVNTADFQITKKRSKQFIWNLKHRKILNSNVPIIGIVGRVEEKQKAVSRMLSVSKRLNDLGIHHKMIFIGPLDLEYANNEEKWLNQIEKYNVNDSIFWFKNQANPFKYMVKFDLYALCSNYEGLPITLLEALSLNVKTIVTDKNSLEFSQGEEICVVSENSEDAIVENLKQIITTNYEIFKTFKSSESLLNKQQKYSLNKLFNYIEGIYEK